MIKGCVVKGIYTDGFTIQLAAMEIVGVTIAARELGLSTSRVRELIQLGKLPAQKLGREYAITREDLEAFKSLDRPVGRPPKVLHSAEERFE
jgi:excisionase family DNA binding protein